MTLKTTILALGTAATLMAAVTSTAFAGPDVAPLNEQQYQVSAQETLRPLFDPRTALPLGKSDAGNLIGAADPHSGPAFDPDVE